LDLISKFYFDLNPHPKSLQASPEEKGFPSPFGEGSGVRRKKSIVIILK